MTLLLLLGLVIGLTLGTVGGGGSVITVPVLVGIAGLTVAEATTASLIVVGTAAGTGLAATLRSGMVRVGTGFAFGLSGIGGAALGTWLNSGLDEGPLLLGFAGLMAMVAAKMAHEVLTGPASHRHRPALNERGAVSLAHTDSAPQDHTAPLDHTVTTPPTGATPPTGEGIPVHAGAVAKVLLAGTLVGLLTGLFGVGGGFVIVPALILLLAFDFRSAVATSLLVISINSAIALVMRADFSSVDWSVVAPFTALATVGVLLGRRIANRLPTAALSAILTILVTTMAVWTAVQGIGHLA